MVNLNTPLKVWLLTPVPGDLIGWAGFAGDKLPDVHPFNMISSLRNVTIDSKKIAMLIHIDNASYTWLTVDGVFSIYFEHQYYQPYKIE